MAQARALRPGDVAFSQIRDGQLSTAIIDKAGRLVAAGNVTRFQDQGQVFTVEGDTNSYRVVLTTWATRWGGTCTCPCPKLCAHIVAAAYVLADLTGTTIPNCPIPVAS